MMQIWISLQKRQVANLDEHVGETREGKRCRKALDVENLQVKEV